MADVYSTPRIVSLPYERASQRYLKAARQRSRRAALAGFLFGAAAVLVVVTTLEALQ